MGFLNNKTSYGIISIILHWLMALMIISLFALGLYMSELDYYDSWYQLAPWWHKSFGVLVFCLLITRLLWRIFNPVPHVATHKPWEVKLAYIVHLTFYGLIAVICLSGYLLGSATGESLEFFNFFDIPAVLSKREIQETIAGNVHKFLSYTAIALVVLHAVGALKHHFIDRDNTLRKMIIGEKS